MRLKNIKPVLTEDLKYFRVDVSEYSVRISDISIDIDDSVRKYEMQAEMNAWRTLDAETSKELERKYRQKSKELLATQQQELKEIAMAFYNLVQAKTVLYGEQRKALVDEIFKTK